MNTKKNPDVDAQHPNERLVIPNEVLDLVRFLAGEHMKWHTLRHEAISLPDDEVKGFLRGKFPIMQGFGNQISLVRIGEQDYDIKNVGKAVKWLRELKV